MNSETPSNPKSDNTNFEPIESLDELQLKYKSIKVTSDAIADIWSEDDVIDVPIEAESAELDLTAENPESKLSEFELSASTLDTELAEDSESSIDPESPPLDESPDEPELFVDRWLDEPSVLAATNIPQSQNQTETDEVEQLEQRKANLHREIEQLKAQKEQILLQQAREVQEHMGQMVEEGTKELKERKMALQIEIEKLERRRERINQEMRSNFAGSSQELAVRVQGFKDYLVGSLQDLATAAEKLELARVEAPASRSRERVRSRDPRRDERERGSRRENERSRSRNPSAQAPQSQFSEPTFADQSRRIQQLLNQYRNKPDYYGSPWQLRRTFEANQAKKVQDWFFVQGGRGAVDSMGSRLQNILVASAAISILHSLYGDRCRILVLTDTPENLGEWRRGLQDCLGISRSNFGANRGVVLFDSPEILVQRAERLLADKLLPMIIIDETEELLNLSMLKFPLWLAFASTNKSTSANYLY
ncbi:MAG TPA: DUF3086 domain-containing protein [Coleofasciculaceae cyanobacterium]|jgi:uncharacterized small protein (DUF1192 family)